MVRRELILTMVVWLACSAMARGTRVAVVGTGEGAGEAAHSLADSLSDPAIQIVPALTVAQALENPTTRPAAPDVLVVVRRLAENPSVWRMDVSSVLWGTRLVAGLWDQTAVAGQAPPAADMAAIVSAALAHPLPPQVRTAIVLPLVSADFSQAGIDDRKVVGFELERAITARGLALVDLPDAATIGIQRAAAGMPPIPLPEPVIVSGQVRHTADGKQVTISLALSYEGKKLQDWTSDPTELSDCAAPLSSGLNELLHGLPARGETRKPADTQKDMEAIAKSLSQSGSIEDALDVYEAALLLDPSKVPLQGECATEFASVASDRLKQWIQLQQPNADWEVKDRLVKQFRTEHADELLWGLSHVQAYLIGTKLSIHQVLKILPLSDLAAMAPDDAARQSVYTICKAKHAAGIHDEFGRFVTYVFQLKVNQWSEEDQLRYTERLGDVWVQAPSKYAGMDLIRWCRFGSLQKPAPNGLKLVEYLERSPNPDARKAAADIRMCWSMASKQLAQAQTQPTTAPKVDEPPPTARCTPLYLPHRWMDERFGFIAAGPHADAYYTGKSEGSSALYYFKDDATGRKVGSMWGRTAPAFDGQYLWFVGNADNSTVILAFDPATNRTWATTPGDVFPPDLTHRSWLAAIAPGQVCVVATIGTNTSRTWVGLLRLDPAAGITGKLVLTCAGAERGASIDSAFDCKGMFLLPGPPGAGERAVPQLYIGRGYREKFILLDPQSGKCSLCGSKGLLSGGPADEWVVWQDKLYQQGQVWDPRSDQTKRTPKCPGEHVLATLISDGWIYYCGSAEISRGKPGEKIEAMPVEFSKQFGNIGSAWEISSLFGLVNPDGFYRISPISRAHCDIPVGAVDDEEAWLGKYAGNAEDSNVYEELATLADERGDQDGWAVQLAGAIKCFKGDNTLESNLWHSQEEMELANYFMHRGDYKTAQRYADDSAQVGSVWSIESSAYAAEGLGDWTRAEQRIREAGEAYNNTFSWYNWCMRSGHGDLKAARKQALEAADAADLAGRTLDALGTRAWVSLFEGDAKAAKPMLLRLATERHNLQAGMELAFMAADAGDAAERDKMLQLVADQPITNSPPFPNPIVPLIRSFFRANGVLDPAKLKTALQDMPSNEMCPESMLFYALGRAYLSRGDKAQAIEHFRHAAGLNSHRVSRTLAAMQLRKLGQPVPPAGQWGPPAN